ncbi:MAG TPA: S8 family serine peptidase [Chitinophagaceae bacterium]|jgi:Subtilisin-like serine proteases
MKHFLLLAVSALFFISANAQFTRFLVKFKNKGDNKFELSNPSAFLSQRAIDRRTNYGINIDSTDLPVTQRYLDSIAAVPNVKLLNVSRWMNQVSIQTTDAAAISKINGFDFVETVSSIAARKSAGGPVDESKRMQEFNEEIRSIAARTNNASTDYFNYGTNSFNEIRLHNGEFLHNIGLRGQGMIITLLDGGFYHFNTLKAMDSIVANNQVLGTWDFVKSQADVTTGIGHGMQCLSTIAANIPGQFIGKAPKASFYLFVTEDAASEYPIEEHNWVCGAERADSAGADIISTSLGYNRFDNAAFSHTYADMNGDKTIAAIGADLAAKKGLLVFCAAGNEGNSAWHYIMTPADADSVVAVGAVNAAGTVGSFSSYGPSADGRVKPDVASVGASAVVQNTNNTIGTNNGTSFACPNMAGLGACLWQAFPEFNNMKIVKALRMAGSIASAPNDRIGYGIPDMKKAFTSLLIDFATSTAVINNCVTTLNWTSKDISAMKYEIERKLEGESTYTKLAEYNGQGNTLLNHSYQFTDSLANLSAGNISYRILQIVDTASVGFTAVFIDTININHAAVCSNMSVNEPAIIQIYPNPVKTSATISIESGKAVPSLYIHVFDMKGSLVQAYKKSKTAGKATFNLPVNSLAPGKYIVKFFDESKTIGRVEFIKY